MAVACAQPLAMCHKPHLSGLAARPSSATKVSWAASIQHRGLQSQTAPRRHPRRTPIVLAAQQATAALDTQLAEQLEQLLAEHSQLEPEELAKRVEAVEKRSAELGCNKVVPELNDGYFNAQPLAGRLKKVTGPSAALTLGGLTFGAVKPADLELAFRPLTSEAPIFKGEREGVPNAYTVTSAFAVPGHDLAGINKAVGTYSTDPENPQRLVVTFTEVVMTPDLGDGGEDALKRWVALFSEANPGAVDPATGVVRVQLPAPASANLDYLVMCPGWQMTRSNFGSIALLKSA